MESFFIKGFTFAILQSSGKENDDIERFHKSVIGETNAGAHFFFKNLPVTLLISVLFERFISSKCLRTGAFVVGENKKVLPSEFMFL